MAGDWIKIEHALIDKPEVFQIADSLGLSDDAVVGLLVKFWCWVDRNLSAFCPTISGQLSQVDRVVSCTGFGQAMVDAGWLDNASGRIIIPNYELHLTQTAKQRALEAKRKRLRRAETSGLSQDKTGTKPGLEKRREEKIKKERVLVFEFPKNLDTEEFKSVWAKFDTHRKEIKKPLTATSANMALNKLNTLGHDLAVASVAYTIEKGWQGIRQPDGANGKPEQPKQEMKYRDPNRR